MNKMQPLSVAFDDVNSVKFVYNKGIEDRISSQSSQVCFVNSSTCTVHTYRELKLIYIYLYLIYNIFISVLQRHIYVAKCNGKVLTNKIDIQFAKTHEVARCKQAH